MVDGDLYYILLRIFNNINNTEFAYPSIKALFCEELILQYFLNFIYLYLKYISNLLLF